MPFKDHLYVPEVPPKTGFPFHEREDEAHVFKIYYMVYNSFSHSLIYSSTEDCDKSQMRRTT